MIKLKYKGISKLIEKDISDKIVDISKDDDNYFVNNNMNKIKSPFKEQKPIIKTYQYYLKQKDPITKERYNIPLLSPTDPEYENKYVDYMKLKEISPDIFDKILNWS